GQDPDPVSLSARKLFREQLQSLFPADLPPAAVFLELRHQQPIIAVNALVTEPVAIGQPRLVDRLVLFRYHALDGAAQGVHIHVRTDAVVRRDRRVLHPLPSAGAVAVRPGVQGANGTYSDDVCRELVVDSLRDVGADLHPVAAPDATELLVTAALLAEPPATRAVDAARHVGGNERSEVLVLHRTLAVVIARNVPAEAHRQVLQFAFASLDANGAVEGIVDQQEFHRRALRGDRLRGFREDLHAVAARGRAGRQRLRRLFHFHEAHAAVGRDAQLLVITETRDVGPFVVGDLHDHLAFLALHGLAV